MLLEHYLEKIDYSDMGVHAVLLADTLRVEAYRRAIEATVKPGMRVIDLGSGTGVLGRIAAKKGAHVLMVEGEERPLQYAKLLNQLLAAESKIELVRARIEDVRTEPCDLVIHELMGGRLFDEGLASALRSFTENNGWCASRSTTYIPDHFSLFARFVHVDPDERLSTHFKESTGGKTITAASNPLIWATSIKDIRLASPWFMLAEVGARSVSTWPEGALARTDITSEANAVLWGFVAHLTDEVILDSRLGETAGTTWGGTIETLQISGILHPGKYVVETRNDLSGTRGRDPWIQKIIPVTC